MEFGAGVAGWHARIQETPQMTILVLLFAELRKRTGTDRLIMTVPVSLTASELLLLIIQMRPELNGLAQRCSMARNGEILPFSAIIESGDEIALLPPASGG